MRDIALGLYRPPFKFQPGAGRIVDADDRVVADDRNRHIALRVREWARTGHMINPQALHDTTGELLAEALTQFWNRQTASTNA